MKQPQPTTPISELFQFRPRWWWDPVPDWIINRLDERVLVDIARVQLETQVQMLRLQAEATERVLETLGKVR